MCRPFRSYSTIPVLKYDIFASDMQNAATWGLCYFESCCLISIYFVGSCSISPAISIAIQNLCKFRIAFIHIMLNRSLPNCVHFQVVYCHGIGTIGVDIVAKSGILVKRHFHRISVAVKISVVNISPSRRWNIIVVHVNVVHYLQTLPVGVNSSRLNDAYVSVN